MCIVRCGGAPVTIVSNSTLVFLSPSTVSASNIYQGGTARFNAGTILGNGPLRYGWFYAPTNNLPYVAVAGASNDTLVLDPAYASQSGYYYFAVSNLVAGVTNTPINLRVQFAKAWGYQVPSNAPVVTNAFTIATGGTTGVAPGQYFAVGADGKLTGWTNSFSSAANRPVTFPTLSNSVVTAVAASYLHQLVLKSDGTVSAFGSGATNVPNNLSGVTAIACGGTHDLALKADGTITGWLSPTAALQSNYGQATNYPAATNVVAIAAGYAHSLALRADGSVVAWGYGADNSTSVPSGITNVIAVAAGGSAIGSSFSLALRTDGTVVQWGNVINNYPAPSGLSNVVAISAGGQHATALKRDGTVVTWGYAYIGLASNTIPADLTNVIAIASGGDHDLALFGTRAPAFTVQPWNRSVTQNVITNVTTITLAAKCAGAPPVSYQWRLNGTNISGATNDTLALGGRNVAGGPNLFTPGGYQLVASNSYGVAISKPAKITVFIPLGDAVEALNLAWTSTGGALWYGQTNITHDHIDAARSGGIGPLSETILQTTLVTNFAGQARFWWKVSSEQFFDTLEFRVNGAVQASISGEVDWTLASIPVPAGTNVLQWRFSKDSSFDAGFDAGFVDQFSFAADPPAIIVQPFGVAARAGANVSLSVTAVGVPQLKYLWTKDGNAVSGNSPVLALNNVSATDAGSYSVTVTNLAGATTSSLAVVRVISPQQLTSPQLLPDGSLQLTSSAGATLTDADLPNFEAQASSDLTNWETLPDALSITNGRLQLQDTWRTNFSTRFYRIVEH